MPETTKSFTNGLVRQFLSVSVSQVELLLRIAAFGKGFFYNEDRWWNLLDFVSGISFLSATKFGGVDGASSLNRIWQALQEYSKTISKRSKTKGCFETKGP